MDKYNKFIIEDDKLILGKVTYHKQLVNDKSKVNGGGWFNLRYTEDGKGLMIEFSGLSDEFGKAKIDDIDKCIKAGEVYTNNDNKKMINFDKYKFIYHEYGVETNLG